MTPATRLRGASTRAGGAHETVHALIVELLEDERATGTNHARAVAGLRAAYAGLDRARWALHHALRALEADHGPRST